MSCSPPHRYLSLFSFLSYIFIHRNASLLMSFFRLDPHLSSVFRRHIDFIYILAVTSARSNTDSTQCWKNAGAIGPTLNQHWASVPSHSTSYARLLLPRYRRQIPPISYFGHACPKCEIGNFVSISSLTAKCAAQKLKNFCSSSLWTCLHHNGHLRSRN